MTTAADPFPERQPALVADQPVTRPGHDRIGDEVIWRPLRRGRIVEAERGQLRPVVSPVDMRHREPRAGMFQSQCRVEHRHLRDIPVDELQFAEPVAAYILQLDDIDAMQRFDRAGPGCPPAAVFGVAQRREPFAHSRDLIRHRQPGHSRGRPKKVCDRVAVAPAGMTTAGARTRPLPGRCMLRPDAMLWPSDR
jgi:hypothetical protein